MATPAAIQAALSAARTASDQLNRLGLKAGFHTRARWRPDEFRGRMQVCAIAESFNGASHLADALDIMDLAPEARKIRIDDQWAVVIPMNQLNREQLDRLSGGARAIPVQG